MGLTPMTYDIMTRTYIQKTITIIYNYIKIIGFYNMTDISIFCIILITYSIRRLHDRFRLRKSILITEKKRKTLQLPGWRK